MAFDFVSIFFIFLFIYIQQNEQIYMCVDKLTQVLNTYMSQHQNNNIIILFQSCLFYLHLN